MDERAEQILIDRYIAPARSGRGPEEATLSDSGTAVWALIGYWEGAGGDEKQVAVDYELPVDAVRAALAYYRRHAAVINARLAANDAALNPVT